MCLSVIYMYITHVYNRCDNVDVSIDVSINDIHVHHKCDDVDVSIHVSINDMHVFITRVMI